MNHSMTLLKTLLVALALTLPGSLESPSQADPAIDTVPPRTPHHPWDGLLPDPVAWTDDGTFTFRRATADERTANDWSSGAFLFDAEAFQAAVRDGAPTVTLPVPLDANAALGVDLVLRRSYEGPPIGIYAPDAAARTYTPTFNDYGLETDDPLLEQGHWIKVKATDNGGFNGKIRTPAGSATLLGPEAWDLDALPGAPAVVMLMEFLPRDDTDALVAAPCTLDVTTPASCGFGVPGVCSEVVSCRAIDSSVHFFFVNAEIKYGTEHGSNTPSLLGTQAEEVVEAFSGTTINMVWDAAGWWMVTDGDSSLANRCARGTTTCKDQENHIYPFAGCDKSGQCYRDRGSDALDHHQKHVSTNDIKLVQTYHLDEMVNDDSGYSLCGISEFIANGGDGESSTIGFPYPTGTFCKEFTNTHEAGHNYNAVHGDADSIGAGTYTVMKRSVDSQRRLNEFSDDNTDNIDTCGGCPRSGTF